MFEARKQLTKICCSLVLILSCHCTVVQTEVLSVDGFDRSCEARTWHVKDDAAHVFPRLNPDAARGFPLSAQLLATPTSSHKMITYHVRKGIYVSTI